MSRPLVVLLVDDQPLVAAQVQEMLAGETDLSLHYCADPAQALAMANEVQPTVILQDLVMPEIDGLMLVKFFRANPSTREIPLIVLSSKEEPAIKAKAFALGANDYLVKLPDKLEMIARLRYHSRGYIAQLERNEAYEKLAQSQRQLAAEVAGAARYVRSLLPSPRPGIEQLFVPSVQLGGDMFGYHDLDPDHLAIYLLDVSGHGVSSSLLAVSAANVLSGRSLAEVDFREPGQVVSRLNDVFQMERQDNKYFTIIYAVFRRSDRTLAYCNGGHPDALLFTGESPATAQLVQLGSTDPIVGLMPEGMPFETVRVPLGPYARLLLYSDGVFEIERPDGSMWTQEAFIAHVAALVPTDQPILPGLLDYARELRGQEMLADDYSFLDVRL